METLDAGTNAIRETRIQDMYDECEQEIVDRILRGDCPDFFFDYSCEVTEATVAALKAYHDGPKDADILAGALALALEKVAREYADRVWRYADEQDSMDMLCQRLGVEYAP